ncbi:nucleotidyltransferase family protein [Clostridium perfringens]|uniref:nucleotidyltransferase family protein n=1 Tax=Clostridium perfringens TaxID=1502 RepID=UPI0011270495|nr:sugar phosphate nucleotidyltransferase [Clostridium perfringens]TPF97766.1 nucleotidyltransferase [Clostridium perfringens A]
MDKITLVIMAAGMGSRYGSLKQIDKIGPNGESIIEYSIYDAIKAGVTKVVFIIKKDIFQKFRKTIGFKIENIIETEYVFQEVDNLDKEFKGKFKRVKPWGTGHAILCCKDFIKEPFIVINADDFYGRETYRILCKEIKKSKCAFEYFMVGFSINKTLTDFGSVSRGICNLNSKGELTSINEKTKIMKKGNSICYEEDGNYHNISEDTLVSMNIWGLKPSIFTELEDKFLKFLRDKNIDKFNGEFFLPTSIDELIKEDKVNVKLLKTNEQWYGVTYKEDKEKVSNSLKKLSGDIYPANLWEEFK